MAHIPQLDKYSDNPGFPLSRMQPMPGDAEKARIDGDKLYFIETWLLSDSQAVLFSTIPDNARIIPNELWEFLWDELQKAARIVALSD